MQHSYLTPGLVPYSFDGRRFRFSGNKHLTLPAPQLGGMQITGIEAFQYASSSFASHAGGRSLQSEDLFEIHNTELDALAFVVRDDLAPDAEQLAKKMMRDIAEGLGAALDLGKVYERDPYTTAESFQHDVPTEVGAWSGPFVYEVIGDSNDQAPVKLVTADERP